LGRAHASGDESSAEGARRGRGRAEGSDARAGSGDGLPGSAGASGYFDRSQQPLEILAFLAPLIVFFEFGLVGALRLGDGWVFTNRAHSALLELFDWVGVHADRLRLPALSLPAAALVVVLLVWQVIARRAWTLHLPTVGFMAVESVLTALPIVVLGWLLAALPWASVPEPRSLGMTGQIAVAVGAGLYEELLFRLVLISLIHSLLRRMRAFSDRSATIAAVVFAALLFAFYHPILVDGHLAMRDATVLFAAGLWWGTLFVVRGFGIAVGSHVAYDAIVLLLPALLNHRAA